VDNAGVVGNPVPLDVIIVGAGLTDWLKGKKYGERIG